MKKTGLLKKIAAVGMIVLCLPALTGCSEFLKKMASKKIENFFEAFAEDFAEDPTEAIKNYSAEEIAFDEFHESQIALALSGFSDCELVIDEINLNEKRTKAEVDIILEDAHTGELSTNIGTLSQLQDEVRAFRADDVEFTITLKRTDDGWQIEDLTEMKDVLYTPYLDTCILDEDGNPLFINEIYIETIYVGDYWYDPISGNPVASLTTSDPVALQNVFYFNRPMYIDFTATLLRDGSEVSTIEVSLDGDVVAMCDFDAGLVSGGHFANGAYTVQLMYDDAVIAESEAFHVN